MAKKKPAAKPAAVDVVKLLATAERLSDDILKTNADIGDVRNRLGDVERRLDELRMLPLTVLELRERLAKEAAPRRPLRSLLQRVAGRLARLLGR